MATAKPTTPRFKSDISIKPKGKKAAPEPSARPCAKAGCAGDGAHRVSRTRENLGEYIWLCLKHAREHNESWDYFRGMDDKDIQSFRTEAMTGHRPTWPLGKRAAGIPNPFGTLGGVDDRLGTFGNDGDSEPRVRRPERTLTRLQIQALDTLRLPHGATLIEIKARYKELVKRFHPDANGGDRGAEERLKQVIKAYGVLRASGLLT